MPDIVRQCPSCPWRVDCVPDRDIPNGYCVELHEALRRTIADGIRFSSTLNIMACHYSKPGEEFACAGWLENQRGTGNNIMVRIAIMTGQLPVPEVDGPQHPDFDATLPKR